MAEPTDDSTRSQAIRFEARIAEAVAAAYEDAARIADRYPGDRAWNLPDMDLAAAIRERGRKAAAGQPMAVGATGERESHPSSSPRVPILDQPPPVVPAEGARICGHDDWELLSTGARRCVDCGAKLQDAEMGDYVSEPPAESFERWHASSCPWLASFQKTCPLGATPWSQSEVPARFWGRTCRAVWQAEETAPGGERG